VVVAFWKLLKLQKYAGQIYGLRCPNASVMYCFGQKNGLGYILGDFFANSSGHPAQKWTNKPHQDAC
jgi:hypothetical protein